MQRMKIRGTSLIAFAAILISVLIALVVQLALLGALNVKARTGDVTLAPVFNAELVNATDGTSIRMDNSRGAAAVQSKNLSINADDALALVLHTNETSAPQRIGVGWVTLEERRRGPSKTNVVAPARGVAHETVVMMRGHPRWAGNITQLGLGLERGVAPTVSAPTDGGVTTLRRLEFIPANPAGAIRLMANAWFSKSNSVLTPPESANRLLPLALWLALICVASLALTTLVTTLAKRGDTNARAHALRTCAISLFALCAAATVFYARFPVWTAPVAAGLCAMAALWLIDPPFSLLPSGASPTATGTASGPSKSSSQRLALTVAAPLALTAACAWLSPMVAAVLLISAAMLLIARYVSPVWATRAAMLALAPILYVAAVAQKMLPSPALLTPVTDPTGALASVATTASGLPGIALGMVALHRFWPAAAQATRWSVGAVAAAVWALAAALAIVAFPKIAAQAQEPSTYIALFFPFVACVVMAVWPRLLSVAQSVLETREVEVKTEADLSPQGLILLEGHADVVRKSLSEQNTALASATLRRMKQVASGARLTHSSQLRIALAESDLVTAATAASALAGDTNLQTEDIDALLDLAHRQGDHARVIALATNASPSIGNRRAAAFAQLVTSGPEAALQTITAGDDASVFAREIAELHLLQDAVQPAQLALVNSGISLTEPMGQAYIARLGMRVQGPGAYEKSVSELALWQPQLSAAQAAMGELLEQQGNRVGAAARYKLALAQDALMWPLHYRLAKLENTNAMAKPSGTGN